MSIFTSQFDQARELSRTYAGETSDSRFWTPATIGVAAVTGLGAVALAASASDTQPADPDATGQFASPDPGLTGQPADWAAGWGEGWGEGWESGTATAGDESARSDAGGEAWSHRGDYTDASVGGDGDSFYFIDGDSSLTT
jgi:hypothetical protein